MPQSSRPRRARAACGALAFVAVTAAASPPASPPGARAATVEALVDTSRSELRWRGTKFGGRGSHAGTLRFRGGRVVLEGASLRAAVLVVDTRSMTVTDMPRDEQGPRARLLRRLLGDELLDAARHPEAVFTLQRVVARGGGVHRADGALTMRGATHPVHVDLVIWSYEPTDLRATGRLAFDRRRWGMDFDGAILTNDLVDDTVHLEFDLVARAPRGR